MYSIDILRERETPFRALTGFSILETIVRLTIRFLITPAAGIACAEPLPKNPRVMAAMLGNSGSRFCPELETIMHAEQGNEQARDLR